MRALPVTFGSLLCGLLLLQPDSVFGQDRKISVEIQSAEALISAAAAVLDGSTPPKRAEVEALSGGRYRVSADFPASERRAIVFFVRGEKGQFSTSRVVDPSGVRESEMPGVVRCGGEGELLSVKRLLSLSEEEQAQLLARRGEELVTLQLELERLKTPERMKMLKELGQRLAIFGDGVNLSDPEVLLGESARIESLLSQAAP